MPWHVFFDETFFIHQLFLFVTPFRGIGREINLVIYIPASTNSASLELEFGKKDKIIISIFTFIRFMCRGRWSKTCYMIAFVYVYFVMSIQNGTKCRRTCSLQWALRIMVFFCNFLSFWDIGSVEGSLEPAPWALGSGRPYKCNRIPNIWTALVL